MACGGKGIRERTDDAFDDRTCKEEVVTVPYFASVVLDAKSKLRTMAGYVLKAAKRVFGIPDFHYYAISDGFRSIFERHPGRPVPLPGGGLVTNCVDSLACF